MKHINEVIKTTKLYDGAINAVILRPLTQDDLVINVEKIEASEARTFCARIEVSASLSQEHLDQLADALEIPTYLKDNDPADRPYRRLRNYNDLGHLAGIWDCVPNPAFVVLSFETYYSRKRTQDTKEQSLVIANASMNAVDVQPLIDKAVAEVNKNLELVIAETVHEFKKTLDHNLGKLNISDEWIKEEMAKCDDVDMESYNSIMNQHDEVSAEIGLLMEKQRELKEQALSIKREAFRNMLLEEAKGDADTIEKIKAVKGSTPHTKRAIF